MKKIVPVKYEKRKPKTKLKRNRGKYVAGRPLIIPIGVQQKYTNAIVKLTEQMTNELSNDLTALFKTDFAQGHFDKVVMDGRCYAYDKRYKTGLRPEPFNENYVLDWMNGIAMDAASVGSQARILVNKAKAKYDQLFGKLAMGLSPWMVDKLNTASFTGSKLSVDELPNLKDEGQKLTISLKSLDEPTKQILKTSSNRSADFIRSIPEAHINKVADAVYTSITSGQGLHDLVPFLEKQDVQITNWARNTALDQTRKTYNGLNLGRMKKIGIEQGEWLHSGGSQHPRELHEDFDGEIFSLDKGAPVGDDGGNYVMPGDESSCRCSFSPVVAIGNNEEDDNEDETD